MKRKMSFAFVIMCFITIISLTDIIGGFLNMFRLFSNFSLMIALQTLSQIVVTLTPPAIAGLLYLNQKKDIKLTAYKVLIICGCGTLVNFVLRYRALIAQISAMLTSSWSNNVVGLVYNLEYLVLGILLICVATSTKASQTSRAVKVFASIGLWLGLFTLLGSVMDMGGPSLINAVKLFVLMLALWCLPKTFYNYENCFFFGRGATTLLIAIVVVVIIALKIITGGSSSRGNCFNCNGSGWDSVNKSSCVWCGGDGVTSWNP